VAEREQGPGRAAAEAAAKVPTATTVEAPEPEFQPAWERQPAPAARGLTPVRKPPEGVAPPLAATGPRGRLATGVLVRVEALPAPAPAAKRRFPAVLEPARGSPPAAAAVELPPALPPQAGWLRERLAVRVAAPAALPVIPPAEFREDLRQVVPAARAPLRSREGKAWTAWVVEVAASLLFREPAGEPAVFAALAAAERGAALHPQPRLRGPAPGADSLLLLGVAALATIPATGRIALATPCWSVKGVMPAAGAAFLPASFPHSGFAPPRSLSYGTAAIATRFAPARRIISITCTTRPCGVFLSARKMTVPCWSLARAARKIARSSSSATGLPCQ